MLRDSHHQNWLAALRFSATVITVAVAGTVLLAFAVCLDVAANLIAFNITVVVRDPDLVLPPTHGWYGGTSGGIWRPC